MSHGHVTLSPPEAGLAPAPRPRLLPSSGLTCQVSEPCVCPSSIAGPDSPLISPMVVGLQSCWCSRAGPWPVGCQLHPLFALYSRRTDPVDHVSQALVVAGLQLVLDKRNSGMTGVQEKRRSQRISLSLPWSVSSSGIQFSLGRPSCFSFYT